MSKNDFVLPGSELGYEEEFVPGKNAFDDDGKIFSDSIGRKNIDTANHEASVDKVSKEKRIMVKGAIVKGIVSMVKPNFVLIEVKESEIDGEVLVVHNRSACIGVRNIADSFVKDTKEFYRVGDIVKARVIQVERYGLEVETKDRELGVIKAFGVKSRRPLILIDNKLRDPVTGDTELRKISSDYTLR